MRRVAVLLTSSALLMLAIPVGAESSGLVTNADDQGSGSLRAALEAGQSPVVIRADVGDIELDTGLVWTSDQPLVIQGSGQTISDLDGTAGNSLLTILSGADTSLARVNFRGPGGFDLTNKGGDSGVKIAVPAEATGVVAVQLEQVSIADVGLHGLHIDDLTAASPASIDLVVNRVSISNAGIGGFDQDGIRVDEAGDGDIVFTSRNGTYHRAGADGVELDEQGDGDVRYRVEGSDFTLNGNYCSFRFEGGELEVEVPEDELDEFLADFTPNEVECLEIAIEDGVAEVAIDIDDAFDIDEADTGSIAGRFSGGSLVGNEDEGLDYDEAGPGGIVGNVERTEAADNTDEAVKFTEEDAGSVKASINSFAADDQDIEFEEAGAGDVTATLAKSALADLSLVEEDDGALLTTVRRVSLDDVEGEETGSGDLDAGFYRSSIDDVELAQEDEGVGFATFWRTTYDTIESTFEGITVE